MKFKILIVFLGTTLIILFSNIIFSAEPENLPLTLQLDEGNDNLYDYVEFVFPKYNVKGDYIGFKINVEEAQKNGSPVQWNQFKLTFYDELGQSFNIDTPNDITTSNPYKLNAFLENGEKTEVVWGNNYIWPLVGFYGTVYIPWAKTNLGTDKNPTAKPLSISKIRIQLDTRSSMRNKIIANLFSFVDVDFTTPTSKETWIGDVRVLNNFSYISNDEFIEEYGTILDFTKYDISAITFSAQAKLFARKMNVEDYNRLLSDSGDGAEFSAWKSNYLREGQYFNYQPFDNGIYGEGLHWQFGKFYQDFDQSINRYGKLTINPTTDNWENALGITFWVKNENPRPISFNIEFDEQERKGLERWSLQGTRVKRIFVYDLNTKEEYGFNTEYDLYLPANFEGWVRIPFSEFEVPDWSLLYGHTDGVLDLSKPHPTLYLTSNFRWNDNVSFKIDNIGIYYEEFEVGKLFDRTLPSIADVLRMTGYRN